MSKSSHCSSAFASVNSLFLKFSNENRVSFSYDIIMENEFPVSYFCLSISRIVNMLLQKCVLVILAVATVRECGGDGDLFVASPAVQFVPHPSFIEVTKF